MVLTDTFVSTRRRTELNRIWRRARLARPRDRHLRGARVRRFRPFFLVFWAKFRMEEQWMRSQFGETYAKYVHRTAALVPYLF